MENKNFDIIEERKKKIINFISKKTNKIYYLILSFIILISIYIRTRNISKLKDITTGTWTLGPDLDPFLFLRWAKEIVKNGSLAVIDTMRYVPLGYDTAGEMKLLSYMIAWLYHFLVFFSKEITVTYAAIIFPVIMAGFTTIAFFLFSKEIFYKEDNKTKNLIALIATSFFVLIPSLLPRTIAGIPEKESAAFFFMFIAFYFFLKSLNSKKFKKGILFVILAGISTALMALIWGGVIFIFFAIPSAILLSFIFGKVEKKECSIYSLWLFISFVLMAFFSTRYSPKILITSTSTSFAIGVLVLIGISLLIMNNEKIKKIKLPKEISSLIFSLVVLLIIVLLTLGPGFLFGELNNIKSSLISPQVTRFGMTVAENRQPYFAGEWKNNFGPVVFNIPLYFWLFFIGSVVLFNNLIKNMNKKERLILTFSYFVFLTCLIFSRYSPSSILDGVSKLSIIVYFGGWIFFFGSFGYFYYKRYKKNSLEIFQRFNFAYILYFLILTLGIIGARGGIRLIMVLGALSPIAVSFLIVKISKKYFKEKEETMKFFIGILAIIILISSIFTLWIYYKQDKYSAENFAPGAYQMQWQKAMSWVRENTSQDAVFAHWWDYGYWLQSIGERATILDGGNAIGYWNHLMGRYVLTGHNERESLGFLYSHNGTHLLIDSTEIGKYTAYSSIGSDKDYDRFSWIQTFLMDEKQTYETNNETIYIYIGGTAVDEDIIWKENNVEIIFPKKRAVIGALVLTKNENGFSQPNAIFIYNNKQYKIPLRYLYIENELKDFGEGLEAGIFTFPKINSLENGQASINKFGASMYLSERTIHSGLARLYLFNENSKYFRLVHSENSLFVDQLKQQGGDFGEFIFYNGFQGSIKIWEIKYPLDIEFKSEYLNEEYPEEVNIAIEGEYN
jgi:asparagine N-glycosylation enzyme membrane subunit Stt3